MTNIKTGQYLLHVATDAICIVWDVTPLRVANLDTLRLEMIDKRELQDDYVQISVDTIYEIY